MLPSVYVPVAVNVICVPCAMLPFVGVMAMELTLAAFTFSGAVPVTPPNTALMVTLPSVRPVPRPLTVIEATLLLDECHCATPVTSCVVLSEKLAVAVYCWLNPGLKLEFGAVTVI